MVAKFFNKTKPVNTLLILFFLLIIFISSLFLYPDSLQNLSNFGERILFLILFLLGLLLINFIVHKNGLTKNNSYVILFVTLFAGMFPQVLSNDKVILTNFLLLLAFRRIYSLRSLKEINEKLFDGALLVGVATLFYSWSILYLFLIYVAISVFQKSNMRTILIPLVGFISPVFLYWVYIISLNGFSAFAIHFETGYNFSAYNGLQLLLPTAMLVSFLLWSVFPTTYKIISVNNEFRDLWKLLLYHTIVSLIVIFLYPVKNGSELLFLFFPVSIILTNYLQSVKEKWFKEVVLYLFIAIAVWSLIYNFSP